MSLRLERAGVRFGGVDALAGVSLRIDGGTITGLIGPNGAGKTTLVNAVTGFVRLSAGTILLGDTRLDGKRPFEVARLGIMRTYQNIRLFGALSVRDNIRGAALRRGDIVEEELRELLERTGLSSVALDARAASLSYGDQRRLEIARALAAKPQILLLDEPAAGMNPVETQGLAKLVRWIAEQRIGVLLIEHDVGLVRAVSDRVVVLNFGTVLAEGKPDDVVRNPAVIEAYLGAAV